MELTVERTDMGVHVIRASGFVFTGYFGQMAAYVAVTDHATALGGYDGYADDFKVKVTAWLASREQVPYQPTESELCQQAQREGASDNATKTPFKVVWCGPAALSYVHGWRTGHDTCDCVVNDLHGKRVRVTTGEPA